MKLLSEFETKFDQINKIQVDVGTQVDLFSNFTTQKMDFDLSLVETINCMKNVGPQILIKK